MRKLEFTYAEENKAERSLTADQIAHHVAVYFSAISLEYEPVMSEKLRPSVQKKLECAAGLGTVGSLPKDKSR